MRCLAAQCLVVSADHNLSDAKRSALPPTAPSDVCLATRACLPTADALAFCRRRFLHEKLFTRLQSRLARVYESRYMQTFIALLICANFVATAANLQVRPEEGSAMCAAPCRLVG